MDETTIDFDSMEIVAGAAFDLQSPEEKVPVAKSWFPGDQPGVSWLVESIDYTSIQESLDQLPQVEIHFSLNDSKQDRDSLLASVRPGKARTPAESKPMLIVRNGRVTSQQLTMYA
jgi:hypothetical protein